MSNDPAINAALLNFCASADDGPRVAPVGPRVARDAADLQWLRSALAAVESPERQIRRLLDTVDAVARDSDSDKENKEDSGEKKDKEGKEDSGDKEDKDTKEDSGDKENKEDREGVCVAALADLAELVEDFNWAAEFALMDGPARALRLLRESPLVARSAGVRAGVAMVIAQSAQLNAQVQSDYAAARWSDVVLPMLRSERDANARAALLHACSCISRGDAVNTKEFMAAGGAAAMMEQLGDGTEKILRRALFFSAYLVENGAFSAADEQVNLAVRAVTFAIGEEGELQTTAVRVLVALALRNAAVLKEVLRSTQFVARLAEWRRAELSEEDNRRKLVRIVDSNERCG